MNKSNTIRTCYEQIRHTLLDGDIGMVLLLGGLGLILWAIMGTIKLNGDLKAYAAMFPFGDALFWFSNYVLCGLAMWYLVATRLPPLMSLIVGGWIATLWGWSFFARTTLQATAQTGNATSVMYIIIGLLIVQRSSRK